MESGGVSVTWSWWSFYSCWRTTHSPIVTSSLSPCFQCDSEASSSSTGHLLEIQNARPRPDTMNQKHCDQRHPKHMPISFWKVVLCWGSGDLERAPLPLREALLLCCSHLRKSIPHVLRTKADSRTEATEEIILKHEIRLCAPFMCAMCFSRRHRLLVGSPFQLLITDAMSSGPQHPLFTIEVCLPEGQIPMADSQSCRSSILLYVQHSVLSLKASTQHLS